MVRLSERCSKLFRYHDDHDAGADGAMLVQAKSSTG